jgi:hypothetical protein
MDNKKIRANFLAVIASILVMGALILEDIRSRRFRTREPHVNQDFERESYINNILCSGDENCIKQIRMRPISFVELCKILYENNFVCETINVSIKEQMVIFLHTIRHNVRFRVAAGRFHRSVETIHRYCRVVLKGVFSLYKHVVRLLDNEMHLDVRNNRRFYLYFKVSFC